MEKETMEENFQATMAQVSAYMPGWTWSNLDRDGQPMKDHDYLIGPNEAKISARLDTYHTRITFSSVYPYHPQVYGKSIDISVSPTKTPEKIAKDLQGRFLKLYLPELAACQERISKANEYEANKKATMQRVADYLGLEIHENGNVYPNDIKPIYSIEPYGEDSVKFKVECSAEKAIKVFEVLKEDGREQQP